MIPGIRGARDGAARWPRATHRIIFSARARIYFRAAHDAGSRPDTSSARRRRREGAPERARADARIP
jgi:hypothetical protein